MTGKVVSVWQGWSTPVPPVSCFSQRLLRSPQLDCVLTFWGQVLMKHIFKVLLSISV